ncbi:MAG: hypothetical protein IK143_07420 [Bacteroidales bacterium]|nr:hypothetical protein [Bacteroidales bacterium]
MDIDLLSKMVKEIILDNDAVTLPGIGSFVAEMVPSVFSDKGYTINPPYRRLYFSPKQGSDTLLVDFYASTNGVGKDDAVRIIVDFLSEMKEVLRSKKIVVFPGLGRLRATKENNFFFVSDEDLDIYPAGFGLRPVSLKTHVETEEEVSAAVEELKSMLDKEAVAAPVETPAEAMAPIAEEAVVTEEPAVAEEPAVSEKPAASEEPVAVAEEEPSDRGDRWIAAVAVVFAVAVVLLVGFMLLGRLAPDVVDRLLYTREQLEILHY